ncbi:alpha-galactosidase [Streptomyces fodineus]|uniref:Alpha-galactosidase n=1 Tax=Streptomyces fodineus TaxID=1904616 RepID=A0A1D7Y4K9_9ACTN|nr:ricin-type beta-trefoil lectin domain protein [Streptomyces fodineus]AOR30518.1 alpha-galactosidase [Streptomyces fodineus]
MSPTYVPRRPLRSAVAALASAGALLAAGAHQPASAAPGSPALTPPMGWNTWNSFGCTIDDKLVRESAKKMVDSGMKTAGYQYVVVDDCWFNPQRDAQGNLQGASGRFPDMKALGDYIHSLGLKFGIYEAPGAKTCAQENPNLTYRYPGSTGSLGHEAQDARQFAAWGVDYLKYDWCSSDGTLADQVAGFTKMRDALRATGRPIVYSINPNSYHADKTGATYNWSQVADMWRTTEDIQAQWPNVTGIVDINAPLAAQSGPGHWNDADMLEVGNSGLKPEEWRSHFALWALMGSPLIAGNDIRSMPADVSEILRNPRLIAVDQDPLGAGGRRVRHDVQENTEVFAKPLSDGSVAIGLFNRSDATTTIRTTASQIGLSGNSFTLTDLWTGDTSTTSGDISASVPAHGVAAFKVSGGTPVTRTTSSLVGARSNRCMDVEGGAAKAGARAIIWDCHGAANQLWTSWPTKELRVFGDMCLDAYRQGTAPGTPVIAWNCNGQTNQHWTLQDDGTVKGAQSGLCIKVSGGATVNDSPLILANCDGGDDNQRWTRR